MDKTLYVGRKKNNKQLQIGMYFEIINEIEDIETIAIGGKIRDIMRIRKQYGLGR